MSLKINKRIIWVLAASLSLVSPGPVIAIQGIVTNQDGRSFEGDMRVDRNGTLQLDVAAGQGSVSYSFSKDSLAGIEFLDAEIVEDGLDAFEQNQFEATINNLESIHRNRSPFFKLLPVNALAEPSLVLGKAYLEMNRFADATGVAGVLLGNDFSDPEITTQANEMRLLAFFGLERWDETEVLAKRWCADHEPFDESALGWWILGEVHLAREDYEKARWISLQPITFSSQYPKEYLQNCFHVAIASWLDESPDEALKLYQDYQGRGYTWPEDHHLEVKLKMATLALSVEPEEVEEEELLTIDEGTPKKDLNLPLETVRKLTTQTETSQSP